MSVSIEYHLNALGEGVSLLFSGNVSSAELLASTTDVAFNDPYSGLTYRIVDLRAVDSLEISSEKLQALAKRDKNQLVTNPNIKFAFICTHQVVQSMVQMWCTYIGECEERARQFSSLDDAHNWLQEQLVVELEAIDP